MRTNDHYVDSPKSETSPLIMSTNDHHVDIPMPDTSPSLTFQSSLEQLFPRKSSTLSLPPQNNPNPSSLRDTQKQKKLSNIITLLRVTSSYNLSIATESLKITLEKVSNVDGIDLNEIIVENLSSFLDKKLNNFEHSTIEAKHTIAQASLGTDTSMHSKIRKKLNVRKRIFQNIIGSDLQSTS